MARRWWISLVAVEPFLFVVLLLLLSSPRFREQEQEHDKDRGFQNDTPPARLWMWHHRALKIPSLFFEHPPGDWVSQTVMGAASPIPTAPLDARHPVCAQFAALMKELREGRLAARDGGVVPHRGAVMSFMELARRTGLSDEGLRKVEHGDHRASLDSAAREAEALGLHLDEALRIARLGGVRLGRDGGETGPQGACERHS